MEFPGRTADFAEMSGEVFGSLDDLIAEFGQGVALWRASGFGKGPDAIMVGES